jgi:electron transfer flavoprotein beta subunit
VRLAVLVKQVPATDKVKMDEKTGTMIREGVEAELNQLDLYAVEEAVRMKEKIGEEVKISVISMGPPMAVNAIKEAISMGCDEGYLLSDRKFAGADTLATAYALSVALKDIGKFDVIFCGAKATDGETGQVGPSVAAQLDMPVLTYVSKIEEIADGKIKVQRAIEGGHEVVESTIPAVISVVKEINEPRTPTLKDKIRVKKVEIPTLTAQDIGAEESRLGKSGSPTTVVKIFYPQVSRQGEIVSATEDLDVTVNKLMDFLKQKEII